MWGTAWGSGLSPRSPNCLNLNLRSFLCCSTNYTCTQLCWVSARRFGWIVPGHPPVGLHWKYGLPSTDIFSSTDQYTEDARDWFCTCQLQQVAGRHKFALWQELLLHFLSFIITEGAFSDTSLQVHLKHILIIFLSQRKCVITPWYFLRDVNAFSIRDIVSLTSGTYL